MDEIVELNVGGAYFTTTRSTLCKEPSSMLARMFGGDMTPSNTDKQGRYFIDRSGQHFGTVLAYLRGEQVDMLASRSLIEEAKYYQLEGLIAGIIPSPNSSGSETASSLEHCCELLRHSVGCDVIDAVESSLLDLWMHRPHEPFRGCTWGVDHGVYALCTQCSSVLDLNNYKRSCLLKLWMKSYEYQGPISTNHWHCQIQLCCCDNPGDQIKGADSANFAKILYKCYGVIVKDLREKGFRLSMTVPLTTKDLNKEYDMTTQITIGAIPALFEYGS